MGAFLFFAALAAIAVYFILIYNHLVQLKHSVAQAWSNIDVSLKQRHDELPKLIEVCRQYMQHERELLERVTQARASVSQARERRDVAALGNAETQLRAGIGALFAVAEGYPELRANENFKLLHNRISQLESLIADRRELYNDSVNANNVRIEQFPDVLVARLMRFDAQRLLKFGKQEVADIDVKARFSA